MTYDETVAHILELPKFTKKNEPSHTREFLARLGDPQEKFAVVHVAGSNGKGSVCGFISNVLCQAGVKVGLFTSPHLVDIRERFRIQGKPCTKQAFVGAEEQVRNVVEQMLRDGLPHPTFFEYLFAVGMVLFAEAGVQCSILETGLGGRLDATNVVKSPILTIITSLSLEHTEILGDTIEKIAWEKAGILKPGVPVVLDAFDSAAAAVVRKCAQELAAPITEISSECINILLKDGKNIDFSLDCGYDVTRVRIPFPAKYQVRNGALALAAIPYLAQQFPISEEAVAQGFATMRWPGRMEELYPGVYLDGAHNVAGIQMLMDAVKDLSQEPSILLFAMVREKNYRRAVELLATQGSWERIVLTTLPDNPRALELEVLGQEFGQYVEAEQLLMIESPEQALETAMQLRRPDQLVFAAGSLYLVGELMKIAGGHIDD